MAIVTWLASLVAATPASAHDKLVGSNPADKSTVDALPSVVTLYFEEPPGTGFSSLDVLTPSARNIDAAEPTITGSQMSVPVSQVTQAGVYTIKFNIISDDGHPVGGVLHFTLNAAHRAASSSAAAASSRTKPASSASLAWIAIAAVLLAAIALARLMFLRVRGRIPSRR